MTENVATFTMPAQDEVMGNLADLLSQLKEFLLAEGCEHKEELLAKFDEAVEMVVSINIPQIPDAFEVIIDRFLAGYAKTAARRLADRMCKQ